MRRGVQMPTLEEFSDAATLVASRVCKLKY